MAMIHSPSRTPVPLSKRKFHPALCLVAGFAFIVGLGVLVHLLFNLVV